ncbi:MULTISPECIES: ABC transporter ATP-binding protein [unclassified Beijerinckia]|uniref:ABC transporter ATP-binding protein n=1 Tax=unclassified Beijerinckia TaxID=2638183 RepID=UPI00089B84C7|nr:MULTISPECIES: ABC transporter ATP-binding protein [unclassified Beijerinckia]MDH7797539.1 putative ABC transport system ATP-binding protein [Beijerinckia sp. GAS462]SEC89678.1 putative ABC transport system ATP-binding protein [Beijerinckia sp. 28-YEA-48]
MTTIVLKSVFKSFEVGSTLLPVVHDMSLNIGHGDMVAIMGPSGSGKSTLMNIMGLLDRPTSGSLYLDGLDVSKLAENDRAKLRGQSIGFVFQAYNLLPRYTAIDNVKLPLVYAGVSETERTKRAKRMLELLGMGHRIDHFPHQLSGGEQQRVAIARAMIASPGLILADEPTGAVDSRTGREILALFSTLHRCGQTVVIVTHDANVAACCGRTIRVMDGRVVEDTAEIPGEGIAA